MHENKYDIEISAGLISKHIQRLTNQLWKLIPMRENEEDWPKQLETVIIELVGFNEILMEERFITLLCKLEGIRLMETDFETYRKTIFECIGLLQRLNHEIRL